MNNAYEPFHVILTIRETNFFTEEKLRHEDVKEMVQAVRAVSGKSRILNQTAEHQTSCSQSRCCRNLEHLNVYGHSLCLGLSIHYPLSLHSNSCKQVSVY